MRHDTSSTYFASDDAFSRKTLTATSTGEVGVPGNVNLKQEESD